MIPIVNTLLYSKTFATQCIANVKPHSKIFLYCEILTTQCVTSIKRHSQSFMQGKILVIPFKPRITSKLF